MKITVKQILLLAFLVSFNAFTAALALKAAVGVGSFDAISQTTANLTGLKVGTVSIFINVACLLGELIILKKDFGVRHLLQIPVSLLAGAVVNLVLYNLLTFELTNYFARFALMVASYLLMSVAGGGILALSVVTFPLEGLCLALSDAARLKFRIVRQAADLLCIVACVVISLAASLPFVAREGTVVGMLIFAPLLNRSMLIQRGLYIKWGIIGQPPAV